MMHKIPVVIGRNRLRGNSEGAMIDSEDKLTFLRSFLAAEAKQAGVVDDLAAWVTNSVVALLKMYEESHAAWLASRGDTIGHVFEAAFPSGMSLLFGDRQVLARIKS